MHVLKLDGVEVGRVGADAGAAGRVFLVAGTYFTDGMARWIDAFARGEQQRKTGAFVAGDFHYNSMAFQGARIEEVGVTAFDASTGGGALRVVLATDKLTPLTERAVPTLPPAPYSVKRELEGFASVRMKQLDAWAFRRGAQGKLEYEDLVVTVAGEAAPWIALQRCTASRTCPRGMGESGRLLMASGSYLDVLSLGLVITKVTAIPDATRVTFKVQSARFTRR
jgi:hypothetical protein